MTLGIQSGRIGWKVGKRRETTSIELRRMKRKKHKFQQTNRWKKISSMSAKASHPSFAAMDFFVNTVDQLKEPPLITANTILSILSVDYPIDSFLLCVWRWCSNAFIWESCWNRGFCQKMGAFLHEVLNWATCFWVLLLLEDWQLAKQWKLTWQA